MRLLSVLGASQALTDHLCRHPEQWRELADPFLGSTRPAAYAMRDVLLRAVGADPTSDSPTATVANADAVDALRVEYRRLLTRLAARDLAHHVGVDDAAAELSDLAAGTLEAALAIARAEVPDAASARLAVIALGKCGGHELNYVSDVDVLYVFEPVGDVDEAAAARVATQLASVLMQTCSDYTGEGTIWPVDANLRPEGKAGPLVRTLASHRAYYERWAKTWEFQALLKARPVAGDLDLGGRFLDLVEPMVWQVADRDGFVERRAGDATARARHHPRPRRRARAQARRRRAPRRGVRRPAAAAGARPDRRAGSAPPATLQALDALTARGYVGREDGEALHAAYAFLRTLEHRIQLQHLRRTHVVPSDDASLRRLGRGMGFAKEPAASLDEAWAHHRREVRRLHEKLFYRPLLEAVARVPAAGARLTPEAAGSAARRPRVRRSRGRPAPSRGADQRGEPDRGDPASAAAGDARVVRRRPRPGRGTVRVPADQREPRLDALVPQDAPRRGSGGRAAGPAARDLALRDRPDRARARGRADARRGPDAARVGGRRRARCARPPIVRTIRRRRSARSVPSGAASCSGSPSASCSARPTSPRSGPRCRGSPTPPCRRRSTSPSGASAPSVGSTRRPTRMAIVAMGRYGGFELSYGSDADVMFVHVPLDGADGEEASAYAHAVANELRQLLLAPGHRSRPGRRRRPPAGGQAGSARAHARVVRRLLRQVVEGVGGPGAAPRRRRRRRRGRA